MKQQFLVDLFMILVTAQQGDTQIRCHQCASKINQSCSDPYNGPEMVDTYSDVCNKTDTHCSKFKTVVMLYDSGVVNGKPSESVTITRGCIRAPDEDDGCKKTTSPAGFIIQCICSGGNCNGAKATITSLVTIISGLLLTGALRRVLS